MRLINNWPKVLLQSYTMWLVYLAGLLELLPYIVPYADDFIPKWISIILLVISPIARVIKQEILSETKDKEPSNASE